MKSELVSQSVSGLVSQELFLQEMQEVPDSFSGRFVMTNPIPSVKITTNLTYNATIQGKQYKIPH